MNPSDLNGLDEVTPLVMWMSVTHTGDEVSYGPRRAACRQTLVSVSWAGSASAVIWRIPHLRVRPPCFRSLSCNCRRAASQLHNAKVVPSDKSAPSARWLALSTLQFTSHTPDLTRQPPYEQLTLLHLYSFVLLSLFSYWRLYFIDWVFKFNYIFKIVQEFLVTLPQHLLPSRSFIRVGFCVSLQLSRLSP